MNFFPNNMFMLFFFSFFFFFFFNILYFLNILKPLNNHLIFLTKNLSNSILKLYGPFSSLIIFVSYSYIFKEILNQFLFNGYASNFLKERIIFFKRMGSIFFLKKTIKEFKTNLIFGSKDSNTILFILLRF